MTTPEVGMAGFIAGEDRQQAVLFPERLDDLVPADALVRVIDGFVSGLDLAALGFVRARASGIGRPGYDPTDLLGLYLYGYMNGVRSSRALERACWTNLELAWLLRRLRPDFKTIADFRKDNGDGVAAACRAFVRFAVGRGLIEGRVVAVDGSRFSAASSAKKRQKRGEVEVEIAAHEVEIGSYLDDLARADAATDPEEIEAEKSRIRAAVEELQGKVEQKRGALEATRAKSLVVTEPEAVVFGQQGSWQPSYNVQLSVDADLQIVLDAEAVANPSDSGQLAPAAGRVAEVLEVQPTAEDGDQPAITLLADAGYSSAKDAVACEKLGLAPVFPVTRTVNPHGAFFDRTAFAYDAETDRLICPAGKPLKPQATPQDGAIVYTAKKTDCRACPLKPQCTSAAARHVTRLLDEAALERVSARLKATPELMNKRAQSVEPAFATLKRWMHGGRFLLRGKAKATTEINLATLAFNLKRLTTIHSTARLLEALA
jgi:transposase